MSVLRAADKVAEQARWRRHCSGWGQQAAVFVGPESSDKDKMLAEHLNNNFRERAPYESRSGDWIDFGMRPEDRRRLEAQFQEARARLHK